jgi:hypothetical protein
MTTLAHRSPVHPRPITTGTKPTAQRPDAADKISRQSSRQKTAIPRKKGLTKHPNLLYKLPYHAGLHLAGFLQVAALAAC